MMKKQIDCYSKFYSLISQLKELDSTMDKIYKIDISEEIKRLENHLEDLEAAINEEE